MYYKLNEICDGEIYVDATLINMNDVMSYRVSVAETLGPHFPVLQFRLDSVTPLCDFFKSGPFLITSKRVKELLEKYEAKFEFYDITLTSSSVYYDIGEYYFSHILCEKDFFNRDESLFTISDINSDYIDDVKSLVINEEKLDNEPVAELYQCFEPIMVVRDDLVREILSKKITGLDFELLKSV